jgi:hypothetical protein
LTAFGELEAEISHAQANAEPVAACQARPYKLRPNIRLSGVLINSSRLRHPTFQLIFGTAE